MTDWRDRILQELTPGIARLTLVADPDGLLLEAELNQALRERGFEIVNFEDPVAFRLDYESRFRSHWDRGEDAQPEIVLRTELQDLSTLPHDLLQSGRRLTFGLEGLFPAFSHRVVAALDRSDLEALFRAQEQHKPDQLGDDATKVFVLRHVFDITPELVKTPSDLLRVLLRRHYREQFLPHLLDDCLARLLRQDGGFANWPLESILPDRNAFFAFLQERWPLFLDRLTGASVEDGLQDVVVEERFDFEFGGPMDLPFDHDDVRVYIDNLFIEGILRPVAHQSGDALRNEWVAVGICFDAGADRLRRLHSLVETVGGTIPGPAANHREWVSFAWRWAEFRALLSETASAARADMDRRIVGLHAEVDHAFLAWAERRYAGLHNQPSIPPVMAHHLPRFIARQLADDPEQRAALVVVDGLALEQWLVLRDVLANQRPDLRFRESATFAWVPTITSVSRQAIFAGKQPLHFPLSIRTTDREAAQWVGFWADQCLAAREVAYAKGLGDGSLGSVRALLSRPDLRSLGLVVDKIDKIMHGMTLGGAGMRNQVRQWAEEGFMAELLDLLLDGGFTIFLTSDHGNVEAEGIGSPAEGTLADVRGERVRLYSDPALRARTKALFPNAVAWPTIGLPEDCLALLAPGRSAFVREGKRIVGHGGISLEEVVVPMVEIERGVA